MFYFVVFVLLMAYALVKWLVLRASPFILTGAGLWVMRSFDFNNGVLLILGAAFLYLAGSRRPGRQIGSWNYQTGQSINQEDVNPDKDAGLR